MKFEVLESVRAEEEKNTGLSLINYAREAFGRNNKLSRAPSNQSMKSDISTKDTTIFQSKSLEVICRLGGLGGLRLPKDFSPAEELSIPTALATLAKHIVSEGRSLN